MISLLLSSLDPSYIISVGGNMKTKPSNELKTAGLSYSSYKVTSLVNFSLEKNKKADYFFYSVDYKSGITIRKVNVRQVCDS